MCNLFDAAGSTADE